MVQLPFKDVKSVTRWSRTFPERYKENISLSLTTRQERERYSAVNYVELVQNLTTLE